MNLIEKLQLAYYKIRSSRRILVIGHTSPDADAIASVGAIIDIGLTLGLEVTAFADKKMDKVFDFIPHSSLVSSIPPGELDVFDAIIILDCGAISRTALENQIRELIKKDARPYIIEIDHHIPQEAYADLEIRLPNKASTTEIIYHLLVANQLPITKVLADCILIGLMTDTGHFLHANSSREALSVASEMLLYGASLPNIINNTVNNKSFLALKIWGQALEKMILNKKTGLAVTALSSNDLQELMEISEGDFDPEVFGDIVSFMSRLDGVKVSLLLREGGGMVKGSLRTIRDDIDVSKIAGNWSGGGHQKAAGFSLPGRLVRTDNGWKVIKSRA